MQPDVEAKLAPETEWETVRTAHFRVHFPPSYRQFTSQLTLYLEDAYRVLSRELQWTLERPLEVVVRGDTDVPNGQASVFPYNRMVIHAVPFSPTSSIGEYDDWIRTLAVHELTHIVANDMTHGIWDIGRSVFGSVAKMNAYQPLWLIEGLAVYEETVHSAYGRGRSAFSDMVVRTAARDGLLDSGDPGLGVTLDRLNDGVPEWPSGNTPYLYGYVMLRMLADEKGLEAPSRVSSTSARYIPFLVNTVAQDAAGTDYYGLWDRAVERMKDIARKDLERIRAQPVSAHRPLASGGRASRGPAVASDGRIYFIRDSYTEGTGLSRYDPASGKSEAMTLWRWSAGTALRWTGGSGGQGQLLYSRIFPYREYSLYSDLFLYDLEEDEEIQLTSGARLLDPDVSPDFRWKDGKIVSGRIAAVKNLADGNQAVVTWDGKEERTLFKGERFERLATPSWGRGRAADWIVFTYKLNGGNERLIGVNVRTRETRNITRRADPSLRVSEVTPSWTEDGALLYASSLGGILNLYRLGPSEVMYTLRDDKSYAIPQRLTHLETGAIHPVARPGGAPLLAMVYGANGFTLAEVDAAAYEAPPVALDSLHEKLSATRGAADRPDPEKFWVDFPDPRGRSVEMRSDDYSAFPAIWPQYWLPFAEKVPDGGLVGAATEGFDALERHRYRVTGAYDTRADFPVYGVLYQYDGLYPMIQLEHRQDNQYVGLLRASNRVVTNAARFHYPVGDFDVTFGATVASWKFFGNDATNGGLQARFGHSVMRGAPNSIDDVGEKGHRADITFTGYLLGDSQYASVQARWEQRIPVFWDRHFVRLFLNGSMILDQEVLAPPFFGGGQEAIVALQDHLVRGYPPGSLFGRRLATANLEYWLPLKEVHHARGTLPLFYERAKVKVFADTGSADFVAGQEVDFRKWPVGVGFEILNDVNLFYHFRFTLGLGFHWGVTGALAGEKQITFGLFNRVF